MPVGLEVVMKSRPDDPFQALAQIFMDKSNRSSDPVREQECSLVKWSLQ
jgi:hypothetical protein